MLRKSVVKESHSGQPFGTQVLDPTGMCPFVKFLSEVTPSLLSFLPCPGMKLAMSTAHSREGASETFGVLVTAVLFSGQRRRRESAWDPAASVKYTSTEPWRV